MSESTPIPFPQSEGNASVFQPSSQDLGIEFAEQFTKLLGKFVFCSDHYELVAQLNALVSSQGWKKLYCREEKIRNSKLATCPFGGGGSANSLTLRSCAPQLPHGDWNSALQLIRSVTLGISPGHNHAFRFAQD